MRLCVPKILSEPVTATHSSPSSLPFILHRQMGVLTGRTVTHQWEKTFIFHTPPYLYLSTKPKQKHWRQPNIVSYLGPQHPHLPNVNAHVSSPTVRQQPWVTIIKGMAYTQICVVVTHNWRWYLLLLLKLEQGSFCMLVVTEQVVTVWWTACQLQSL